jgi:hypothetical protein
MTRNTYNILLLLCLSSCNDTQVTPFPSGTSTLVLQSDYATGALHLFLENGERKATHAEGDSSLHWAGERLFLLQRSNRDMLIEINPKTLHRVHEWPLEPGANPHDIALVGDQLWLTQYGRSELMRLDALSGVALQPIDLSRFADPDGRPEMSALVALDDRVLVTLQLVDFSNEVIRYPDKSLLLSLAYDGSVLAQNWIPPNPYGDFQPSGDQGLTLTLSGDWSDDRDLGQVFAFSPNSPELGSSILDGAKLGARPTLSLAVDDVLWVITDNRVGGTDLWHWKISEQTGTVLLHRQTWDLACLHFDRTRAVVWVCDRNPGHHGLLRFDLSGQPVSPRFPTELAPTAVLSTH